MIDATKLVIEGAIDRALRQIAQDSRRGLRNLVDLGLLFNKSGWRYFFLRSAQNMLSDENSAYYELVRRLQSTVDNSRLKAFGINLGYESCTRGARRIQEVEKSCGFDVPWLLTIAAGQDGVNAETLQSLITQGKELGIYAYALLDRGFDMETLRRTLEENRNCAFLLLMQGSVQELEPLTECQNFMVSIEAGKADAMEEVEWLQSRRLLYGVHTSYNQETAKTVVSAEALDGYLEYEPAAVFLLAQPGTDPNIINETAQAASAIRNAQDYTYLLFEAVGDAMYLDKIISQDDCALVMEGDGTAIRLRQGRQTDRCSTQGLSLRQILQRLAPKGGSHG